MSHQKKLTKEELMSLFEGKNSYISDSVSHKKALEFISENDFPDSKNEKWKNTDISKITRHKFTVYNRGAYKNQLEETFNVYNAEVEKMVFVNGRFSEINSSLSNQNKKIFIGSIKQGKELFNDVFTSFYNTTDIAQDNIFSAFNTAFAQDGAFIYIPENTVFDKPIHILFYSDGENSKGIIQNRNLIVTGKNSSVQILTSFHSLSYDTVFTNVVNEIFALENSNVVFNTFQGSGEGAFQINNTHIVQQKSSSIQTNISIMCGELVRNDLTVNLNGEFCNTELNGFYIPEKEQYFDNHITINHNSPNCTSTQLYKGVVDNKAEASFFGKVYVAPCSQKTDASQSNRNIILSDYAKAHSMPQLEIYADDVSCSHGSTTGQLDENVLFYLKSRGISERIAKTLLLTAFIHEVIDKIQSKPYRDLLSFLSNKRLKGDAIEGMCTKKICPSC